MKTRCFYDMMLRTTQMSPTAWAAAMTKARSSFASSCGAVTERQDSDDVLDGEKEKKGEERGKGRERCAFY